MASLDDLYITPSFRHFRLYMLHYGVVVAHDGLGAEVDGEGVGDF